MKKHKSNKVIIIITGTPCSGKSYLASKLSLLLKAKHIELNKLLIKHNLTDGYDKAKHTHIVNISKLKRFLRQYIAKNNNTSLLIDSHLSHYLPKSMVNLCIVTKCSLPTLKKRLMSRSYSASKVRENLDAEIFDICHVEAVEAGHNILEINTSRQINFKNLQKKINSLLKKTL